VKRVSVPLCVDGGEEFQLIFPSKWITKCEIVVEGNTKMTVAKKEGERLKLKNEIGEAKWAEMIKSGDKSIKLTQTEQELKKFEEVVAQRMTVMTPYHLTVRLLKQIEAEPEEEKKEGEVVDDEVEPVSIPVITASSAEFLAELALTDQARLFLVVKYAEFIKGIIEQKNLRAVTGNVDKENDSETTAISKRPRLCNEADKTEKLLLENEARSVIFSQKQASSSLTSGFHYFERKKYLSNINKVHEKKIDSFFMN
jgi:hypothetical protein